jgi:hypothetical protein
MAKLNKERIALAILSAPSLDAAARQAGISTATLYRIRKQADFQDILTGAKNAMFGEALVKGQGYCLEAMEVLHEIMMNRIGSAGVRVQAAKAVLDVGLSLYEDEQIIKRIEALEKRLNEQNQY